MRRWQDPAACRVLIDVLHDDNETVQEWAAAAVGDVGCTDAVLALEDLRRQQLRDGVPPHFTGPVAVRRSLTRLGARDPIVPPEVEKLSVHLRSLGKAWPVGVAADAVEALARHDQVVLYVMFWRQDPSREPYWQEHEGAGWSLNLDLPWQDNVIAGREAALIEISGATNSYGLLVKVEWIDRSDLESH